jgi:hypothetical protein
MQWRGIGLRQRGPGGGEAQVAFLFLCYMEVPMTNIFAVVTEMPGASVTPDGSFAEMIFLNSDGSSQTLRFNPELMMVFLGKVFELFQNQRIQKGSTLDHIAVQPLRAATTFAECAAGGDAVILGFRLQNGIPVSFAISTLEAQELHRQLDEASNKAKMEFEMSRH